MRTILSIILGVTLLVSCTDQVVYLPDLEDRVAKNEAGITAAEARLLLIEALNEAQDLRLDALEAAMKNAEGRLDAAEADIDANEANILELFGLVEGLTGDLATLRADFEAAVTELQKADKQTRKLLRKKIRNLRNKLCKEIKNRKLADTKLQNKINKVHGNLKKFEARQKMINKFFTFALFMTNMRISQLEREIDRELAQINRRLNGMSRRISALQRNIRVLRFQIADIHEQMDEIESKVVSVVYPCGEGNSEEILLQTQDGLVAYFQTGHTESIYFEVGAYVPSHQVCRAWKTKSCWGRHYTTCTDSETIPGMTIDESLEVEFYIIDHAYLDVLNDGYYRTTDGWRCTFEIRDGEVYNEMD
jgi:hypothetical protein